MVEFKALKYKHQRKAAELSNLIQDGKATNDDISNFIISLVRCWDFVDGDTNEPISPSDVDALDELTIEQYRELMSSFNTKMKVETDIPKETALPSSSSLTQ